MCPFLGRASPLPPKPSLRLSPGQPPRADAGACVANSHRSFLLGAQRAQRRWARLSRSPSGVPVGPLPSRRSQALLSPVGWGCEAANPTRLAGPERKSPGDVWKTFSPWEIVGVASSFSKPRHCYLRMCVVWRFSSHFVSGGVTALRQWARTIKSLNALGNRTAHRQLAS